MATGKVVGLFGTKPAKDIYAAYNDYNRRFFADKLGVPFLLITQAKSARTLGDYIGRDEHGLESRIRISPAAVKRGPRFVKDVLLHEMIHAWQMEVEKDGENSYRGHGPKFAAECTRIGKRLGLAAVGVKGRDGLPDCAHWPMIVRPEGYYPEAYTPPTRKPSEPSEPSGEGEGEGEETISPFDAERLMLSLRAALKKFDVETLEALLGEVEAEIERRDQ